MKKALFLLLFTAFISLQVNAQKDSSTTSKCHTIRTKNHGFYLIPYFFFQSRTFQVDGEGKWKHAGMLGDTLRSYLHPLSGAHEDLKRYKHIRIAGIVQMWGLGLGSHIACIMIVSNKDYLPTSGAILLCTGWAFYFSGAITYHLVAKKHYFRALEHHRNYCSDKQAVLGTPHLPAYAKVGSASSYPGLSFSYHF